MADDAELGPLDVQLMKPDELFEWTSGLTPIQALTSLRTETFKAFEKYFLDLRVKSGMQISTRAATNVATRLAVGLFKCIYAQLDPMRLGEYQRAMLIGHYYGARLIRENLSEAALERLIAGYSSHDFVIDRPEAADLFNNVREPNEKELLLAEQIQVEAERALRKSDSASIRFLSNPFSPTGEAHGQDTGDADKTGKATTRTRPSSKQVVGDSQSQPAGPSGEGMDKAMSSVGDGQTTKTD